MIHRQNTDHSITIEGSKEVLDKLKEKISNLLGIRDSIGDNLFIELQSVFKPLKNEQGEPLTISAKEALQSLNKTPEYTDNCKNFLQALGNKEKPKLPKPPVGSLTFKEVLEKFGIQNPSERKVIIKVPDELKETLKNVKRYHEPDDNEKLFSILEDQGNTKSFVYKFEIISDNEVRIYRYFADKDDKHFIYTSLRLLCFYQAKELGPVLNLFKERAASYLINCLPAMPDKPLNQVEEFHCELIDIDYEIPPVELFFKNPVRISVYEAIFLIEIFSEIQDKHQRCNFDKPFLTIKTVYLLSILSPLPVAFQYIDKDRNVELTFADTTCASADFIFNQVKFAMGIFSRLPQFSAYFSYVDSIYWPSEKFITINEKIGLAIVRSTDTNRAGKTACFQVWSLLNKPIVGNDLSQVNILKQELHKIYDEIKLYRCDQCNQWFSTGFGGECVITEHPGFRIEFEDTHQMEKIEYVQEGGKLVEMKFVNYSCCGEKPENAPGCYEMLFPNGHLKKEENGKEISCSDYKDNIFNPN
ncbi:hypothetical protein M9Y10_025472 [Tritrichomonas musculus]|uniref:Uncharacterized protein n=1 Tax=Tritrichomonas musculus TaxID=1915356 RepID=A0ABR2H9T5_9EUKA